MAQGTADTLSFLNGRSKALSYNGLRLLFDFGSAGAGLEFETLKWKDVECYTCAPMNRILRFRSNQLEIIRSVSL